MSDEVVPRDSFLPLTSATVALRVLLPWAISRQCLSPGLRKNKAMIMTRDVAEELRQHVTSVIIGADMVPRFSLRSFRRLRDRVLAEAAGDVEEKRRLSAPAEDVWADVVGALESKM